MADLIAAKFDERDGNEQAWGTACEAMVAADEAETLQDARALLVGPRYNASVVEVRQALALVEAREEGSILGAFARMAQVKKDYQEYADDDIDQSLLGVGKFDELKTDLRLTACAR